MPLCVNLLMIIFIYPTIIFSNFSSQFLHHFLNVTSFKYIFKIKFSTKSLLHPIINQFLIAVS